MPAKRRVRAPTVRTGQGNVQLTREEFRARFMARFYDPTFDAVDAELDQVAEVAWDGYSEYRKSPRTRRAGSSFFDPDYQLPLE